MHHDLFPVLCVCVQPPTPNATLQKGDITKCVGVGVYAQKLKEPSHLVRLKLARSETSPAPSSKPCH